MVNLIKKYQKFILLVDTPDWWKKLRMVIHWLTIPLKLLLIGGLALLMHLFYLPFLRKRKVPSLASEEQRAKNLKESFEALPIYDNGTMRLHVNRVPYYELPNGTNHNMDHQCSRQGTYTFLMGMLGKGSEKINLALIRHLSKHVLLRGYDSTGKYNANTVSGDMLLGLSLGLLKLHKEPKANFMDSNTYDMARDVYDEFLINLIENDYALLEVTRQDEDEIQREVWDEELKKTNGIVTSQTKIKSARGMFQPGLETVGAQAITLLAAVKIGSKLIGASYAKKEYKKLFWNYGYGILSLFPTAFIPSMRGYFNEHNCLQAAYILSKLSDNKWEKMYWNFVALYVWSLSYPYHNGYFTGLIEDLMPGLLPKSYMKKTLAYLHEEEPELFAQDNKSVIKPKKYPVKYNEQDRDEFSPDKDPLVVTHYDTKVRSSLGFLAQAVMMEPERAKEWLKS